MLLAAVLLALILPLAQADEAFTIDKRRVLQGMKRFWLQGYEPPINQNAMTFVLPILSISASGSIEAEIILADETYPPFKLQTLKAKAQSSESDVWAVCFTQDLR